MYGYCHCTVVTSTFIWVIGIFFSGRYLTRIDSIQLLSTLEQFTTDDLDDDDEDDDDADKNGVYDYLLV